MSSTVDLFSVLGEDPGAVPEMVGSTSETKLTPKRTKKSKEAPASTATLILSVDSPAEEIQNSDLLEAFPLLTNVEEVRQRAIELLSRLDPQLTNLLPAELYFPTDEDPFAKTAEEWEAVWYSMRESAFRVYLNMRMEFRQHLERALKGQPNDLTPWTYWAFNGVRPEAGEPVYGLSEERRTELGWDYSGPATDFRIYGDSPSVLEATGG